MSEEKFIDENWKNSVKQEKVTQEKTIYTGESFDSPEEPSESSCCGTHEPCDHQHAQAEPIPEITFSGYVTSLAFQAIIFLGEVAHPVTNKIEENYEQAKFIIDTLLLLRKKTQGNLSKEEEDVLNGCLYELELKYVEKVKEKKNSIKTNEKV